jgi:hypothetical protein
VFDALALPFASYASDPQARFQAEADTKKALRDVLGYRLYHDLQRGWRVTSPTLSSVVCSKLLTYHLRRFVNRKRSGRRHWLPRNPRRATGSARPCLISCAVSLPSMSIIWIASFRSRFNNGVVSASYLRGRSTRMNAWNTRRWLFPDRNGGRLRGLHFHLPSERLWPVSSPPEYLSRSSGLSKIR